MEFMDVELRAEENSWESRPSGRAEGDSLDEFLYELIFPSSFLSGGDPPPKPRARHILLCPSERHVMCRENNNGT